ncbi:cupin domain-containing protein [Halorussus limi]|uniref:Cupin domain-containing protein n=1 Tax=Halorussus limi TaxID=2938695 RepID=A0A8U0HRI3_9EURY|nr:cupin domain-containing protein [Halorussus limi]UPV73346.1 cupin domain-containing protein [Halorussus limi]
MEKAAIADAEPEDLGGGEARRLSDPLDATGLALNRYRIPPGQEFPSGLHAHGDQEEVFVVLAGTATFERLGPDREDAGEVAVRAGEAVRFAPGEYQSGRNAVSEPRSDDSEAERSESSGGDADLVALALGAPRDSDDVRVPLDCPECGHGYLHPEAGPDGVTLDCPDCETANVPRGCPDCGAEMRVALGEGSETVVRCPECSAEAETPFTA